MRIDANDPQGRFVVIKYHGKNGWEKLERAFGFDSEEKWVEIFVNEPGNNQIMVADGQMVKAKICINYDVVEKSTGRILLEVRQ